MCNVANLSTKFFLMVTCLFLFAASGCVKDRGEVEKEILNYDPSFVEILDKRKASIEELNNMKTALLSNKKQINREICLLKTKKTDIKRKFSEDSGRIKQRLDPEKREMRRTIVDVERELKRKMGFVRDANRDIEEINVLIKKKESLALTQEEIRTWNDRLSTLTKNKEAAILEINRIKEEVRITKLKLYVMEIK